MTFLKDYKAYQGSDGPPYECKFCGDPSWVDPSEQEPPVDYCHPEDHGSEADFQSAAEEYENERGDWLLQRMKDEEK